MEGDQGVNLVEYPDVEMMIIDLANQIAGEINTALMGNDHATLAVPGGTTLSAALTGPGGESVPGVEQSLTTPEDEVVPTPEPILPQPTATSTPGAAAPGDGPDAAAPGDGAAPEPAPAAPEQAGPEQAGPAQEAEASPRAAVVG